MSRNYKIQDQSRLHFLSFATVNWIDVFIRIAYKDIVVDSLNYCSEYKGFQVFAWCIMSNHVHLIANTTGLFKLEEVIRDMKKHTAKTLLKAIAKNPQESRKEWMLWMFERAGRHNSNNKKYQFWQQHNQPIELNSNLLLQQKLDYIHQNPVSAGFVSEPEHYPYSSAIDYVGGKGKVKINFIS